MPQNAKLCKSNRKAEQNYLDTEEDFAGNFQYQLDNKEFKNPQEFYNKIQKEWDDSKKYLSKFSTSENFGLSNEFKEYRKQLLAIKFISNIENYRKISDAAAAPEELMNELQNTVKIRYAF